MKRKVLEYIANERAERGSASSSFVSEKSPNFNQIVELIFPKPTTYTWSKLKPSNEAPEVEMKDLSGNDNDISEEDLQKLRELCFNNITDGSDARSKKQVALMNWALLIENPNVQSGTGETPSHSPVNMPQMNPQSLAADQVFLCAKLLEEAWPQSWEYAHMEKGEEYKQRAHFTRRILKDLPLFLTSEEIDRDKFYDHETKQNERLNQVSGSFETVKNIYAQAGETLPDWPSQIEMAHALSSFSFQKNLLQQPKNTLSGDKVFEFVMNGMNEAMKNGVIRGSSSFNEMFAALLFVRMQTPFNDEDAYKEVAKWMKDYHLSPEYHMRELFPFSESAIHRYFDRCITLDSPLVPWKYPIQYLLESYSNEKFDVPRVLERKQGEDPKDIIRAKSFAIKGERVKSPLLGGSIHSTENNFTKFQSFIESQGHLPASVKQAALTQLSQNGCLWAGGIDFLLHMSDKKNSTIILATGENAGYMVVPTNEGLESSLNISISPDGKKLFVDCSYTPKALLLASTSLGASKNVMLENPVPLAYRLELFENEQGQACVTVHVKSWENVEKFMESVSKVAREFEQEHPELRTQMPLEQPRPPSPSSTI